MQPSLVQTLSIPQVGGDPTRLIQAGANPMRVVVRNNGGNVLLIAFETPSLSDVNNMGSIYQLPVGQSETFVLAPQQSIFAAGLGGGGTASIAASEAIPGKQFYQES